MVKRVGIVGKATSKALDEEDLAQIYGAFQEKVIPKLQNLGARLGNIDCSFAGEKYKDWIATFQSQGNGFQIIEIEHDPEADIIDLDL